MQGALSIEDLPGVGKYYAYKLNRLNIKTVEDLIYFFPVRYDDFSNVQKIESLLSEEKITIQGTLSQIKNIRTKNGKFITVAKVNDQTGIIEVIWFNQPYLTKNLKIGVNLSLSGRTENSTYGQKLISPTYEIINSEINSSSFQSTLHTGRLVSIYSLTDGITSKWVRTKIAKILPGYLINQIEFLPPEIKKSQKLKDLSDALLNIHFPKSKINLENAVKRLSFDELLTIQLTSLLRKKQWEQNKKAHNLKISEAQITEFEKSLPFTLTNAQLKVKTEILSDLQKNTPANRILVGDVGSGKTVIAAIAFYACFLNGLDTIFASPTEILALQHQKTLTDLFTPFGISVGIYTKSKKQKGNITCGTHALLNTFENKNKIGLVVVDEQHRFGVAQRAKLFLSKDKSFTPHLLTMTATPIPRTLALTVYQDLDLSTLNELPKGRLKISTFTVANSKRPAAYKFIEEQITKGRQAFIITPFVEPSESIITVKSATEEFNKIKKIFPAKIKIGLLHGKLKSKEKEQIIKEFKSDKIQILVATPVVEVGIDVANATVMMIESSERFGLAQLHQLRGRVGRSIHKSYCLLFTNSTNELTLRRLKSMEKINIGSELAEIDLRLRGAGDIYGTVQSGFTNLKFANFTNTELLSETKNCANQLIQNSPDLSNYPKLKQKINLHQVEYIQPN